MPPASSPSSSSSDSSLFSHPHVAKAAFFSAGAMAAWCALALLRKGKAKTPRPSVKTNNIPCNPVQPSSAPAPVSSVPAASIPLNVPLPGKPFHYPLQRRFLATPASGQFRVLSYNILADNPRYALSDSLSYCPLEHRQWAHRWPRIQSEILQISGNSLENAYSGHNSNNQAGVVFIQESTPTIYRDYLQPFFSSHQFYCQESSILSHPQKDPSGYERQTDAIFINENIFDIVKIEVKEYSQLSSVYFQSLLGGVDAHREGKKNEEIHNHSLSEPNTPNSIISEDDEFEPRSPSNPLELSESDERIKEKMSWFRDSCTIMHLRLKPHKYSPEAVASLSSSFSSSSFPPGFCSGPDVFLMNTHLHYHPANPEVKTFQTFLACRALIEIIHKQLFPHLIEESSIQWDSIPIIFAGDFNSLPVKLFTDPYDPILPKSGQLSGVYELLTTGRLNARHSHHPAGFIPKMEYIHQVNDRGTEMTKPIAGIPGIGNSPAAATEEKSSGSETVSFPSQGVLSRSDSNSSLNSSISSVYSQSLDSIIPSFSLPFRFSSSYATIYGHEPAFTTKTPTFQGCIDYIFYNSSSLSVSRVLEMPYSELDRYNPVELKDREEKEKNSMYYPGYPYLSRESSKIRSSSGIGTMGSAGEFPPIPNEYFPSDHLCLCAEMNLLDKQEILRKEILLNENHRHSGDDDDGNDDSENSRRDSLHSIG